MLDEYTPDEMARYLHDSEDYRVLRRLDLTQQSLDCCDGETQVGIVIDVETTGLNVTRDKVIELAMRRCRFDERGVIVKIDQPYVWREDPGAPLDPVITRLTGLTDVDLVGQKIDDRAALSLLRSADVCIAHNAAFDRKFVEKRLPDAAGKPWACSLNEIDWLTRGFDGGRNLGWLLMQQGLFHNAHSAAADVDAVVALLSHTDAGGRTALAELIETANQPTWNVRAIGANFYSKDLLKARGYRWHPDDNVWQRDIKTPELENERSWLLATVYAPASFPRGDGPAVREITWMTRHG